MFKKVTSFFKRLNGVSTSFFGISWTPSQDERQVIYKLAQELGNRRLIRVYHGGFEYNAVVRSCEIMRQNFTDALIDLSPESKLRTPIEQMRTSIHIFQTVVEERYPLERFPSKSLDAEAGIDEIVLESLSGVRGFVGKCLTELCDKFEIQPSKELQLNFIIGATKEPEKIKIELKKGRKQKIKPGKKKRTK